ncbi:unnamed protein product, partial [Polarella glacialis]
VAGTAQHQPGSKQAAVSPEDAAAIFKELPALGQLHGASVPSMMSAVQFWERCLKSRYFLEASGKEVAASHGTDPLFDSLVPPEPTSLQPEASTVALASHLEADLSGEWIRDGGSAGERPQKRRKGGSLIERLNERSAGVLAAMLAFKEATAATPASAGAASSGSAAAAATTTTTAIATATTTTTTPAATTTTATSTASSSTAAGSEILQVDSHSQLREAVDRRREALRHTNEALQEDLGGGRGGLDSMAQSEERAKKAARLQLKPEAGALRVPKVVSKNSVPMGLPGQNVTSPLKDALLAWSLGSASQRDGTTESGARWVLKTATDELLSAERLLGTGAGASAASDASQPKLQASALETCTRATTLLRHFWSSRGSEAELRSRLAEETAKILPSLEAWQGTSATVNSAAAARSLLPPLRRALEVNRRQAATLEQGGRSFDRDDGRQHVQQNARHMVEVMKHYQEHLETLYTLKRDLSAEMN